MFFVSLNPLPLHLVWQPPSDLGVLCMHVAYGTAVFTTNLMYFSATFLVFAFSIVRGDDASAMFSCPGKFFTENT